MKIDRYDSLIREIEEDGFIISNLAEDLLSDERFRAKRYILEKMEDADALPMAAIELILEIYPNVRYGFDFNPTVKNNKNEPQPVRAWVKFPSIDWTVAHTDIATALVLALLKVMRDEEKLRLRNEDLLSRGV